jgi:heme/copper-type cytochrome/quinol oxidase subunit 4
MKERVLRRALVALVALVALALAVVALLTVLAGFTQPPQPDEGTLAHVFQLAVVAYGATFLLFMATADGKGLLQSLRPLTFSAAVLVLAFGALYWLEHRR